MSEPLTQRWRMLVILFLSHLSLSGAVQNGIFGGAKASRPYMASLQTGGCHTCGGVLIREDYVLTAAHCYNRSNPIQEVVLGAHRINKREKSQQHIIISKFIPHPKYGKTKITKELRSKEYDIMLLKLQQKAKLKKVKVLELPREDVRIPAGQQCAVAGWGRRKAGEGATDVLYEAKVTLEEPEECKRIWKVYYNQDKMTCSVSNGKQGFCQGDSGGPLICGKGKAKVLYGLMSYTAMPCNNTEWPEVYTRVPPFLPWIRKVLSD